MFFAWRFSRSFASRFNFANVVFFLPANVDLQGHASADLPGTRPCAEHGSPADGCTASSKQASHLSERTLNASSRAVAPAAGNGFTSSIARTDPLCRNRSRECSADALVDSHVDGVAGLLADGLPQRRLYWQSVAAIALWHQRAGEGFAVDGPSDLHEPAGREPFRHVMDDHAGPRARIVALLKLSIEVSWHDR